MAEKPSSSFAAQHQSGINFMPVEERVYFVRHKTAANVRFTPKSGHRLIIRPKQLPARR